MTDRTAPTPTIQRLVEYIAGSSELDPDMADLVTWLAVSPRFRAFTKSNRDKIRKKLRFATTTDARRDVAAELRVAALLLADRRFEVAFEAYGAGRRGPDYTVTFRAGRACNVEVTRRRGSGTTTLEPGILGKFRQLPPSASNVVVVAVSGAEPPPDPGPVIRSMRTHADRRDDAYFRASGLDDSVAFHAGLLRLAAVVTLAAEAEEAERVAHWRNPGARILLPEPAYRALVVALAGDPATA